jgi:hypothetical protein
LNIVPRIRTRNEKCYVSGKVACLSCHAAYITVYVYVSWGPGSSSGVLRNMYRYHHSNKTGICCLNIEKVSSAPVPTHHKKWRSPPLFSKALTSTPLYPVGEAYIAHCYTWKHYIQISRARNINTRKSKEDERKKERKTRTPTKSDNDKGEHQHPYLVQHALPLLTDMPVIKFLYLAVRSDRRRGQMQITWTREIGACGRLPLMLRRTSDDNSERGKEDGRKEYIQT